VKIRRSCIYLLFLCLFVYWGASPLLAKERGELSRGQTIYVPAYSHIYSGNREKPFLLTATLSIRNIDAKHPIQVTKVGYYATKGKLLKDCLDDPVILQPLESIRYVISQNDSSGGSGANFLVRWQSKKPVNPPIVETVMIGTQMQQGVSFTSRGQVIRESSK